MIHSNLYNAVISLSLNMNMKMLQHQTNTVVKEEQRQSTVRRRSTRNKSRRSRSEAQRENENEIDSEQGESIEDSIRINSRWTNGDVQRLRDLRARGMSYKDIGKVLQRSQTAAAQKAVELNLTQLSRVESCAFSFHHFIFAKFAALCPLYALQCEGKESKEITICIQSQ